MSTVSATADPAVWEVLQLIADYQHAVYAAVSELQRQLHTRDLLRSWHKGAIARSGKLLRPRSRYQFHGVGCRFEIGERTLEVDFGPQGRYDGFDAWRLERYAESAFEWNGLTSTRIARGLAALEELGVITKPAWDPGPHLHYFSEDIETRRSSRPTSRKSA